MLYASCKSSATCHNFAKFFPLDKQEKVRETGISLTRFRPRPARLIRPVTLSGRYLEELLDEADDLVVDVEDAAAAHGVLVGHHLAEVVLDLAERGDERVRLPGDLRREDAVVHELLGLRQVPADLLLPHELDGLNPLARGDEVPEGVERGDRREGRGAVRVADADENVHAVPFHPLIVSRTAFPVNHYFLIGLIKKPPYYIRLVVHLIGF